MDKVNKLGIDIATNDVNYLINRLKNLKSTKAITDGGRYHQDRSYSQILIDTVWSENELDDWLYKTKFNRYVDYVGVFERKGEYIITE